MKLAGILGVLLLVLSGCSSGDSGMERGIDFRTRLLQGNGCSFQAEITADYGDYVRQFSAECVADSQGGLSFSVISPQTIAGITGTIRNGTGKLTFDEVALQFDTLAEGQISPVTSVWVFLKTLRSGCITSAAVEDGLLRLSIDDSYEDNALHLDVWFGEGDIPVQADILYDGRRVLSLTVREFVIS